jgi:hypothetical protein
VEQALVTLYAAGLTLEDRELDDESDPAEGLTSEEAAGLQRHLGEKLGDSDLYKVLFEPHDLDSTPVVGSLSDDIVDIYRDLRDGFAELHSGKPCCLVVCEHAETQFVQAALPRPFDGRNHQG